MIITSKTQKQTKKKKNPIAILIQQTRNGQPRTIVNESMLPHRTWNELHPQ